MDPNANSAKNGTPSSLSTCVSTWYSNTIVQEYYDVTIFILTTTVRKDLRKVDMYLYLQGF